MWAQKLFRQLAVKQLAQAQGVKTSSNLPALALTRIQERPCPQEAEEASQEPDKLLSAAAKEDSLKKIYKIIDDEGESFTESNVTTAFSKVGKLGAATNEAAKEEITCTRSFQTLVDMVLLGARRYTNGNLLAITDACGKLGFDDDMLLDKITTRLLTNIHELGAAELHDLVRFVHHATSLGELSSPSIVLFQALQQRLEELGDEVTPEQNKELNAVFEKLGYSDSGIKA